MSVTELGAQAVIYVLASVAYMVRRCRAVHSESQTVRGGAQLEKQVWILEPDTPLGVGPGRAASQLCDAGLVT